VEAKAVRHIPGVTSVFDPPSYTRQTLQERIEPYATEYEELEEEHPDHFSDGDEPDPEFYQPTERLLRLEAKLELLRRKAFRTVPNPDYDPEGAEKFWQELRERQNQTTIEVGQSYAPEVTDE
jgi:hypothetical protein